LIVRLHCKHGSSSACLPINYTKYR
jgi:hypothetical protein